MYFIRQTREFYSSVTEKSLVTDHETGQPAQFRLKKDAEKWLEDLDREIYYTSHDEVSRPAYKIIRK